MKAYLLAVGSGAARSLPVMVSALSCGAAKPLPSLDIFLAGALPAESELPSLLADLNVCHSLLSGKEALFPVFFSFAARKPDLPDIRNLSSGPSSRLLLSALRGPGIPLSPQTDEEAAEWAFSALLPSWEPFQAFLEKIDHDLNAGEDVRLSLLGDLCDAWAAGAVLALLPFLRQRFSGGKLYLSLLALSDPGRPRRSERLSRLRRVLTAFQDRSLLRVADDRETLGADALWLLSLPSSLHSGEETDRLSSLVAARVLAELSLRPTPPSCGLHARALPPILTLQSLGEEAVPFAAFLRASAWCLSDLFPALTAYLDHPTLLRSLAPATRNGLFKRLFRATENASPSELPLLTRTLRAILSEVLGLLQSLPEPLRLADVADVRWKQAVDACGRTVTVAAEYGVSRAEAEESGVDRVQPVHRASLADTEEEKTLRRLDDLARELSECRKKRSEALAELGGYRAYQCLQDCLNKCLAAQEPARRKMESLSESASADNLALGLQQRRLRLLEAAVRQAREDLAEAAEPETLSAPATVRLPSPFSGQVLTPETAEALATLLTANSADQEAAERTAREHLPSFFPQATLADARGLLRMLLSACEPRENEPPLVTLFHAAVSVTHGELSGLRLISAGLMPALPLLPDLLCEQLPATLGHALTHFPPVPEHDSENAAAEERGLLAMLLLRPYRRSTSEEASLIQEALQPCGDLLTDSWLLARHADQVRILSLKQGEVSLPFALILPGRAFLPARLTERHATLVPAFASWFDPETRRFRDPCASLAEGDRLILREQLTRLLTALAEPGPLKDFLADFLRLLETAPSASREDPLFPQRVRAACGLRTLKEYSGSLQRVVVYYEPALPEDPTASALAGATVPASKAGPEREILYTWKGTPFARESKTRLLDSPCTSLEKHILSTLEAESGILSRSSDDYHDALVRELQSLLNRYPDAEEDRKQEALSLLHEAEKPLREKATVLAWPWDMTSPSIRTILVECLGSDLAPSALQPFSDRLTLFPARGGEIIGDAVLSQMCRLVNAPAATPPADVRTPAAPSTMKEEFRTQAPTVSQPATQPVVPTGFQAPAPTVGQPVAQSAAPATQPFMQTGDQPMPLQPADASTPPPAPAPVDDAVLPPLSPAFAETLCRTPAGRTLLQPGFLTFERTKESGIRVTLNLEGNFSLRLTRLFTETEILSLYSHDMPTLALWPSLPFPADQWKAYYAYAHLPEPFRIEVVPLASAYTPVRFGGQAPRYVARLSSFPICFHLYKNDLAAGSLPNLLPEPETGNTGPVLACVDPGSVGVSVVFATRHSRGPLQGPTMVRTLLNNPLASRELLRREFLPAVPVSALLPEAVRLFHGPDQSLPFEDGIILMAANLRDLLEIPPDSLHSSQALALHQVMLLTALQARADGAESLSWRFAIPDEMAPEGRNALVSLCRSLAEQVAQASCLPPAAETLVSFAAQSAALGAYFRLVAQEDTRGGFMTLDFGASTADISLYLRGREQAVRTCQLPLGIHYMLLPSFLKDPELPLRDFGFVAEEGFRRDLNLLAQSFRNARADSAALHQAALALDTFIADRLPQLMAAAAQRRMDQAPSLTGALLLLHFSFLMMLSGLILLQLAMDPARNDVLPEQMSLCLSGRGTGLLEALSNQTKAALWRFLTMFRNRRVGSLSLLFSAEKKMEIPVGLSMLESVSKDVPEASVIPAAIAVRPEELLPEFLKRFCQEFPMEAGLLFPNFFTNDFYRPFTPFGEAMVSTAIDLAFGHRDIPRPYDSLAAWPGILLDLIREHT